MSYKRKTNFLWKHKNGKLTSKAKAHLSRKATTRLAERRRIKFEGKRYRYAKVIMWGCANSEEYYPQVEIKAFIYSRLKIPAILQEKELNRMCNKVKEDYDVNGFFIHQLTRRRIAFEREEVTTAEVGANNKEVYLTIYDGIGKIRNGFPKKIIM